MRPLDLAILVLYLVGVTAFGCSFYFRKGAKGAAAFVAAAAGWFPQQVRDAGLTDVRRFDFAPGVEYGYAYATNLFGHLGDMHVVRIELGKVKVRPFVEEGALRADGKLRTTSAAAAATKALFSINGGFFRWKDNPEKKQKALIPFYRMKLDGNALPSNAGGTLGLAFSADGSRVKVGPVKDAELAEWENFMDGGGSTTLAVRKDALAKAKAKPPYTPEAHPGADGYVILNSTSDGDERAVLDHIQFLDAASDGNPRTR